MEEIIKNWKKNAEKDHEKNFLYIRSLKFKDYDEVDRIAKEVHDEAFEKIDCLKCGNCCRSLKPILLEEDIERISTYLNISNAEMVDTYLEKDTDGDWRVNTLPCPFFNEENNKCKIYPVRPKDCAEYPHTNKKGFASRSHSHSWNTIDCPAVFYIVEEMKNRI